ncbi:ATP synthase F1 subunit delta [Candidatus Auribacterota bacterium]
MKHLSIAQRYALALLDAALALNIPLENIEADLNIFLEIWNKNISLQKILLNPIISKEDKKNILKEIIEEIELLEIFTNLIFILTDKDRLNILSLISEIFSQKVAEKNKKATAYIKSATKLSTTQEKRIKTKLAKLFNKSNILIETAVDSSLIGGMIINVGSERIDATVSNSLKELGRQL